MSEKISVSLEQKHRQIISRYGKKIGVTKRSTTLQALLVKFDQYEKAYGNGDGHPPASVDDAKPEPTERIPA